MKNYTYLSPKEQHIFSQIEDYNKIFTIIDIFNLMGKKEYYALMGLRNKGHIIRLRRGVYATKKAFLENPYKIAAELENGVIGFISALKMHELIDYEPNAIFILTESHSYNLQILNYRLCFINLKRKWGFKDINGIFVTDIEKTFVDSVFKPDYSGGYPTIAKALFEAEIEWRKLIGYLEKYGKSSLYQKMGYLLSLLHEKGKTVPDYVFKVMKKNIKNKLRLVPNAKLKYLYIKEWKIMDNLGKNHILGGINGS